jgi:hypothetical protein
MPNLVMMPRSCREMRKARDAPVDLFGTRQVIDSSKVCFASISCRDFAFVCAQVLRRS